MTGKVNENEMANMRHAASGEASWRREICAVNCETKLRMGLESISLGTATATCHLWGEVTCTMNRDTLQFGQTRSMKCCGMATALSSE